MRHATLRLLYAKATAQLDTPWTAIHSSVSVDQEAACEVVVRSIFELWEKFVSAIGGLSEIAKHAPRHPPHAAIGFGTSVAFLPHPAHDSAAF